MFVCLWIQWTEITGQSAIDFTHDLVTSFDQTLPNTIPQLLMLTYINDGIMTHLPICVSPWGLRGFCWVSLGADFCVSAATRTTLLSMLIAGLQCDSEDVAMHWRFQAWSATVAVFTTHYLHNHTGTTQGLLAHLSKLSKMLTRKMLQHFETFPQLPLPCGLQKPHTRALFAPT